MLISNTVDLGLLILIKIALPLGFLLLLYFFLNLFVLKKRYNSLSSSLYVSLIVFYCCSALYYWVVSDGLFFKTESYSFSLKFKLLIIYLFVLLGLGLYHCKGFSELAAFFIERVNNHPKEIFGLNIFAPIWFHYQELALGKEFLKTSSGKINLNFLVFAWFVVFVLVVKEIMKKFLYFFMVSIVFKYEFIPAIFYISNYLLLLFLISLIGIDKDMASFINHYFGPYVLGWLGSYQYIGPDQNFTFVPTGNYRWTAIKQRLEARVASGRLTVDEKGKIKFHKTGKPPSNAIKWVE